jgi:ferritin
MLSQALQDAISEQIKNEMYSAYMYLSMSAWFEDQDLPGFAHWMRAQFIEEETHALKFTDYVLDHNHPVALKAIPQPPTTWNSPVHVFEQTLEHEQKVTAMIKGIYAIAEKEGDYTTQQFLNWFLNEQVEEERNADLMLEQLRAMGNLRGMIVMLDGHKTGRSASLSV